MKPTKMDQNRSKTVVPNQQHDLAALHQDSGPASQPEPTLWFMTFKNLFPMDCSSIQSTDENRHIFACIAPNSYKPHKKRGSSKEEIGGARALERVRWGMAIGGKKGSCMQA